MTTAEKLIKVAENIEKVYEAGVEAGKAQGGNDEYYNVFWDNFQSNGARTDYGYAFRGWSNAHNYWKPKYDMKLSGVSNMFYNFKSDVSLPELCKRADITIDWSGVGTFGQPFSYCNFPDIGVIDTRGAKSLGSILAQSTIKKAEIIMKDDGSQHTLAGAFSYASQLTDLIIRGKIGDTVDFKDSKYLNKESITSIINALLDTASGKTVTFSKTAVDKAFDGGNLVKQPFEETFMETTITKNGLTFTDNLDGTITLNGTASANTEFILGNITLPVCPSLTVRGNIGGVGEFGLYDDTGLFYYVDWGTNGENGETYEDIFERTFVAKYVIYEGKTFNNHVLKPEIIGTGASASLDWQILVGSKPNWTINLA